MSVVAHVEIEVFSAYRARYTRKRASNPRTYTTVFKTVAYVRGVEAIFRVYPDLYVEKTSISKWAATLILGWLRKLI